jgi:xanthine/uracil/vitamin C permease (AzgA family)
MIRLYSEYIEKLLVCYTYWCASAPNTFYKADSSASAMGALFGCAPVTSYVESSAGVEAGSRTGLTAVVVGSLFLLAIVIKPFSVSRRD